MKGCTVGLFVGKKERSFSAAVKDAISRMILYLSYYDKNYLFLKAETKRDALYPHGIIVIGRERAEDAETLRVHNNFLSRIKIITYDELVQTARKTLDIVKAGR